MVTCYGYHAQTENKKKPIYATETLTYKIKAT